MDKKILKIESPRLYYTGDRCLEIEPGLEIKKGITVLSGENASGKTTFAQIIEKGRNYKTNKIKSFLDHYPHVKNIEFSTIHSMPGIGVEYYQQRYEDAMNDSIPSVKEIIGERFTSKDFINLCLELNLLDVGDKKINHLSSGELRKLLIINALSSYPDLLILDNPFIGLDFESLGVIDQILLKLKGNGLAVVLIIPDEESIPVYADHYIYASGMNISTQKTESKPIDYKEFNFKKGGEGSIEKEDICILRNCTVKYKGQPILENINWEIKRGDRWNLRGANGSGKSTLLSLLNADNPKSYSNDLTLFGRKRGSGESIWEIKKKIGYISPEMQLHFHGSGTVLELIANGLNDTVGMYVKPNEAQKEIAERWIEHFGLRNIKDKTFTHLSSGEKQLMLIARAFIKEPELLILDEPMHGLDTKNKKKVQQTIEEFLQNRPDSSFIMVTHNKEELPCLINKEMILKKKVEARLPPNYDQGNKRFISDIYQGN